MAEILMLTEHLPYSLVLIEDTIRHPRYFFYTKLLQETNDMSNKKTVVVL